MDFAQSTNSSIVEDFGYLFIFIASVSVLAILISLFSPLKNTKIGGKDAKPLFSKLKYFAIILCTTVATGILFWGSAEPIYHLKNPPLGIEPFSKAASEFALEAVFLHWTFIPYAMYSVVALMFALGFYNYKNSFSLKGTLSPILPKKDVPAIGIIIDNIALIGLILGMSASLGAGILTLSGGIESIFGINDTNYIRIMVTVLIVSAFIISAISGVQRGIKWLSNINLYIFIILALFVFIFYDPLGIIAYSFPSLLSFFRNFFRDLILIKSISPDWAESWSIFNWANWLAWAPMTGVFLGKISYGLTVRQFLVFNWLLPSIFGFLWMSVFSGIAILLHQSGAENMAFALDNFGPQSLTYLILEQLPYFTFISIIFLISIFISYVTAADSNIDAMSYLSSKSEATRGNINLIKITWGILIGSISLIMINSSGIKGIKMLSNLGGLPSAFLMIFILASLIKIILSKNKSDLSDASYSSNR